MGVSENKGYLILRSLWQGSYYLGYCTGFPPGKDPGKEPENAAPPDGHCNGPTNDKDS